MAKERPLSKDEIQELADYQAKGRAMLPDLVEPNDENLVIAAIKPILEELRGNNHSKTDATELAFALGFLYGEQVRKAVGWQWAYVTQDGGFASYAVVSRDKAFMCYPIKDIYDFLLDPTKSNASRLLFNMIKSNDLGTATPGRYQAVSF